MMALNMRQLDRRIVLLDGTIDDDSANQLIAKFCYLKSQSPVEPIYLMINSSGGLVAAGLAIYDSIKELGTPIRTHCIGKAQGLAAVLLSAGAKPFRSSAENAQISFGLPWRRFDSDENLDAEVQRLTKILINLTARNIAASEVMISDLYNSERELDAIEAQKLGIIDMIGDITEEGRKQYI